MRRGLMVWDAAEVPPEALAARVTRLQDEMRKAQLDAFVIYTNFPRPAAVCFLTAFTPYWADALLLVPREGTPVFATALSRRVANWIRSVMPAAEIINTPTPGVEVGKRLAADPHVKRIGVLESDALPSGLYDDIEAHAPLVAIVDGSAAFAKARRGVDAAEARMLARADALAREGLDVANVAIDTVGDLVGKVERTARLGGAEETYVHIAADLDQDRRHLRISRDARPGARCAIRASVAYKGSWVRRIRTFAQDAAANSEIAMTDGWFAASLRDLKAGVPLTGALTAAVARLPGAELISWRAESCVGSYPLEEVAGPGLDCTPAAGMLLVVTIELRLPGGFWIGAAPVIVGREELAIAA